MRFSLAVLATAVLAALAVASAGALDIETEVSLPDGTVGTPYTFQFTGSEGCQPYNFAYSSGTVPPGLTIQQNGELNGTPTVPGTFVFWVELTDGTPGGACHSNTPSQGRYTVIIAPKVEITANLTGAKVGAPFSVAITATGGGSLQWSVSDGALPPGLTLSRVDGTLSGTPSTVGSYTFTIKVGDDKRSATKQYTFVVGAPLAVAPAALAAAEVGVPFTAAIPFTGGIGPLQWSGTLPAGLTLDAAKGTIAGTPTAAGSASVPLTVVDSDGQTVNTTVAVSIARRLRIATTVAARATVGKSYRLRLATIGGVAPRAWTLARGKLPAGLTLDRKNGLVGGTPRKAGRYPVTLRVADRLGVASTRALVIAVSAG